MVLTFKYRTASHRRALFRNLVSELLEKESITTTWAKAKETQSYAEKVIQFTKYNDEKNAKILAQAKLFKTAVTIPKLFNELGPRYKDREGGYTRVLKLEVRQGDSSPQAIIELVDGKREIKFWLVARIVARLELQGLPIDATTQNNVDKLIKFKPDGQEEFRKCVEQCKELFYSDEENLKLLPRTSEFDKKLKKLNIVMTPRPIKTQNEEK